MNDIELLPCPFCNGKPTEGCADPGAPYPGGYYFVACENEDCPMDEVTVMKKAFTKDADEAIAYVRARWNTRPAPDTFPDKLSGSPQCSTANECPCRYFLRPVHGPRSVHADPKVWEREYLGIPTTSPKRGDECLIRLAYGTWVKCMILGEARELKGDRRYLVRHFGITGETVERWVFSGELATQANANGTSYRLDVLEAAIAEHHGKLDSDFIRRVEDIAAERATQAGEPVPDEQIKQSIFNSALADHQRLSQKEVDDAFFEKLKADGIIEERTVPITAPEFIRHLSPVTILAPACPDCRDSGIIPRDPLENLYRGLGMVATLRHCHCPAGLKYMLA